MRFCTSGTSRPPPLVTLTKVTFLLSWHHPIIVAMIFTVGCCNCHVGPPPLHFGAAHEQGCEGDTEHWHWDRCALPGSIVWSSFFFGHRQKSAFELDKIVCSHDLLTYGDLSNCQNPQDASRLIQLALDRASLLSSGELNHYRLNRCSSPKCQPQYTAFDADHPCLLPTRPILPRADARIDLLPPITLSLYIENRNNVSKWSWWETSLNFSFAVLNCAPGAPLYHNWKLDSASILDSCRCCNSCPHNHFPKDSLRLHANVEYLLDNIFLNSFTLEQLDLLNSVPCSPFRVSVSARLAPSITLSRQEFPNDAYAKQSINWQHEFHAATQRVPKVEGLKLVRRHSAKAISHKLCQRAASYSSNEYGSFQTYHASSHTVSALVSFENNRSVSVVVVAASVKHTKNGRAAFEALVWTEIDHKCGTDDIFLFHCVGNELSFVPMCEVAGTAVLAVVTQYKVSGRFREAVISCDFQLDFFMRNSSEVLITLSDASKGFKMVLPMCSLAANSAVRKIVACSQPIYNAHFLEKRWPGVLRAWVLYHVCRIAQPV